MGLSIALDMKARDDDLAHGILFRVQPILVTIDPLSTSRLPRQFTPPRQLFPCPAWVSPGGQSRVDREPGHFLIHPPARKPACSTHRVLRAWVCSRFRLAPCAAHCGPNVFPAPIAA